MILNSLISDLGQRIVSFNKFQQRLNLTKKLIELDLPAGSFALDYGCGTGQFARIFRNLGLDYFGYDVDADLLHYAKWLHPQHTFVHTIEELLSMSKFDVILASCCFHHISDHELISITLKNINRMMTESSVFFLIDILPLENNASHLRRIYNKLERGGFKRSEEQIEKLFKNYFVVESKNIIRSDLLSIDSKYNPVYNKLVMYNLKKR